MVLVHDFYSVCRSITGPGLGAMLRAPWREERLKWAAEIRQFMLLVSTPEIAKRREYPGAR